MVEYSDNTVSGNAVVIFDNELAVTYDEKETMPDRSLEYLKTRFQRDDKGRFYPTAPYIGRIGEALVENDWNFFDYGEEEFPKES